jgi:hypothetical protein
MKQIQFKDKIVIVKSCELCPFSYEGDGTQLICVPFGMILGEFSESGFDSDTSGIPEECQLEDYQEE